MTTKERIAEIREQSADGRTFMYPHKTIRLLADVAEAAEAFMAEYSPTEASDEALKLWDALAALGGDDA